MNLKKEEKELLIGVVSLAISIFFIVQSSLISLSRYRFVASARIFPLLVSITMGLISVAYIIRSCRHNGGLVPLARIGSAAKSFARAPETRQVLIAIVTVLIYYLLAAAKGRFYIVSAAFLVYISCVYVKGGRLWLRILGVLLTTAACYFLFYRGFQVQLY